ncbi:hypothetical protein ACTG4Q_20705 [Bradyrhizobium denitrificans]
MAKSAKRMAKKHVKKVSRNTKLAELRNERKRKQHRKALAGK